MTELGPPRDDVPDIGQIAAHLLDDLRSDHAADENEAKLDAIGTLTGLTEDDLVELAILLGRRLVERERNA